MNNLVKFLWGICFITFFLSACGKRGVGDNNNIPSKDSTSVKDSTPVKQPRLGANFNANLSPDFVDFSELKSSGTAWVRAMLDFFDLYKKYKAGKDWIDDPSILTYKAFRKHGYKTVLAIRYMFKRENLAIPDKGTAEFDDYLKFTKALLQVVLPSTNVIVPGNEPIFEAPKGATESLNLVAFYEALAATTHKYVNGQKLDIPIFLGSFTAPYKPDKQNNTAFNYLMDFAKKTDWIRGVDIHIHHTNNQQISESMDYINGRIRSDQQIIVSEFSLVGWWDEHLKDNLSAAFKAKYSSLPDSIQKVWQYINYGLKHPRPLQEWNDWNKMTPWLSDRKHYICEAWQLFTGYSKFWMACYSFKISWPPKFTATTTAWILNSLLDDETVVHQSDGDAYGRIWYMDDFKAIQEGARTSCSK